MCIPQLDAQTVRLIYADRCVECASDCLCKAEHVNVDVMMSKNYVLHVARRDHMKLRVTIIGYDDVMLLSSLPQLPLRLLSVLHF